MRPDEPARRMLREARPDLSEAEIDALLVPLNEAGKALAELVPPKVTESRTQVSHPCPEPGCDYVAFYAVLLDVHLTSHHPIRSDEPTL